MIKQTEIAKAVCSILLGLAITFLVGSSLGFPVNYEGAVQSIKEMNRIAQEHPEISSDRLDQEYKAAGLAEEIAFESSVFTDFSSILRWHSLVLWISLFVSFVALRPRILELSVCVVAIGAVLGLYVSWTVATILVGAAALSILSKKIWVVANKGDGKY